MTEDPVTVDHRTIEPNGVALHAVTAGPTHGDPVICLHGFPEFWYGFRNQIPALADAGYRVIVPDQRGYNLSDKPDGLDTYTLTTLADDAVGILDSLGYDQARVVGHDWGAAVLWQTLLEHPNRIEQAVTMNVPHPAVFDEYLFSDFRQTLKSTYMYVFQLPGVAEWLLTTTDCWGFRQFLASTNSEDAFTPDDMDRYREAWTQPGAATAMVNWYRALFQRDPGGVPDMTVEPETLVIWGTEDPLLEARMAEESAGFCRDGRLEEIPDATHWLQHERPERVNELICSFFE